MTAELVVIITVVMMFLVLVSCVVTLVLTYRSHNQNYYKYNMLSHTNITGRKNEKIRKVYQG